MDEIPSSAMVIHHDFGKRRTFPCRLSEEDAKTRKDPTRIPTALFS
jgi:hypothetical protein